jgi:hypothetical protein
MPTPGGLPKTGEVWQRTWRLPPDWKPNIRRFVVIERSRGDYWSMTVWTPDAGRQLLVDPAYWMSRGELRYIDKAGPVTRKKAGLS